MHTHCLCQARFFFHPSLFLVFHFSSFLFLSFWSLCYLLFSLSVCLLDVSFSLFFYSLSLSSSFLPLFLSLSLRRGESRSEMKVGAKKKWKPEGLMGVGGQTALDAQKH